MTIKFPFSTYIYACVENLLLEMVNQELIKFTNAKEDNQVLNMKLLGDIQQMQRQIIGEMAQESLDSDNISVLSIRNKN